MSTVVRKSSSYILHASEKARAFKLASRFLNISVVTGDSLAVYLCPSLCKIPSFSGGGCLQKGNLMRRSVELERIPGILQNVLQSVMTVL